MRPLQNKRSGFRQKAALFDSLRFAALCRDAATTIESFAEVSAYKAFPLFLAAAMFCGCATQITSPEQSAKSTIVSFDPYAGGYFVTGKHLDLGGFPNITQVWLRGGFDKNKQGEFFQLYAYHWSQTGWLFLSSASDIDAIPLPVRVLSRDLDSVSNDAVVEQVIADLTRDYLIAHQSKGLNIRFSGSKGSLIAQVNGMYIEGFLKRFDEFKSSPSLSNLASPPSQEHIPHQGR